MFHLKSAISLASHRNLCLLLSGSDLFLCPAGLHFTLGGHLGTNTASLTSAVSRVLTSNDINGCWCLVKTHGVESNLLHSSPHQSQTSSFQKRACGVARPQRVSLRWTPGSQDRPVSPDNFQQLPAVFPPGYLASTEHPALSSFMVLLAAFCTCTWRKRSK